MMDLIQLYTNNDNIDDQNDTPYENCEIKCNYQNSSQLANVLNKNKKLQCQYHMNVQGLMSHWDGFRNLFQEMQSDTSPILTIGLSEIFYIPNNYALCLSDYELEYKLRDKPNSNRGGVGIFIHKSVNYKVRRDLSIFMPHVIETIAIEIVQTKKKAQIVCVAYQPNTEPKADLDIFTTSMNGLMEMINNEHKNAIIMEI